MDVQIQSSAESIASRETSMGSVESDRSISIAEVVDSGTP
jgi:hypothetical protein